MYRKCISVVGGIKTCERASFCHSLPYYTHTYNIEPYVRYSVSVKASTRVGFGEPVEVTLYSKEGGK